MAKALWSARHQSAGAFRRAGELIALVVAGEAIFGLPFVLPRIFRPTLLDVFAISSSELGTAFSRYGWVAALAYFVGGPLADRFSPRSLMTLALFATAAGGVALAQRPSSAMLEAIYAWWGLTTVLLFWAPLIRSTRAWGGASNQGRAYGMLDAGRGLTAALLGALTVPLFARLLPDDVAAASLAQRSDALMLVVWIFTGMTALAGLLVWFALPEESARATHLTATSASSRPTLHGLLVALRMRSVWLQAFIVLCAYVGYRSADDYSIYVRDVFGYDDVAAAHVGTLSLWVRPFAALAAGLWADRIDASRATFYSFACMAAGSMVIACELLSQASPFFLLALTIVATSLGVNALRGVYFALFGETQLPYAYTGSAVGLVSVIGYTPDIFMGPVIGYFVDPSPDAHGHGQVFAVVALFAALGMFCTYLFRRSTKL